MHLGRIRFGVITAGIALMLPAYFGVFFRGYPTVVCPLPLLTTIPALLLAAPLIPSLPNYNLYWLALLVPSFLFFVWNRRLFHGDTLVPRRSRVLLAVLAGLSAVYFVFLWATGVKYDGLEHTVRLSVINALWLAILTMLLFRQRRFPTFINNLLFHWTLFAWLGWYAFPYLGELP